MKKIEYTKDTVGHLKGEQINIRYDGQLDRINKKEKVAKIVDVEDESETVLILANPAPGVWTTPRVPINSKEAKAYNKKFAADAEIANDMTERVDNVMIGATDVSATTAADKAAKAGEPANVDKAIGTPLVQRDEKTVIEDIKKASTVEDVDRIAHGDTRAAIVKAADDAKKALNKKQ